MLLKIRAWSDRVFNYSCVHKYRTGRLTAFRAATKHITSTVRLRCLSVQHLLDAPHPSAKKGPKYYLTKSYGIPRGKILRFQESCLGCWRLHDILLQALGLSPPHQLLPLGEKSVRRPAHETFTLHQCYTVCSFLYQAIKKCSVPPCLQSKGMVLQLAG